MSTDYNIVISQRTSAHIIKAYAYDYLSPPTFVRSFGEFGVPGSNTSHLDFPWMIAKDSNGNIFVCDHENLRIVKLNSDLSWNSSYDTSSTIGRPCAMIYDNSVGDLYVIGIHYHTIEGDVMYMYVNIERLTTNLASLKFTKDIMGAGQRLEQRHGEMSYKPTGIVRGYDANELLIVGIRSKIYSAIEGSSFSTVTEKSYSSHTRTRFMGVVKHPNGDLYLNTGKQILRFNSTFVNVGSSDFIDNVLYGLKVGPSGSLMIYNVGKSNSTLHPGSIMRFDENLNLVETICVGSGLTVETNFDDVMDFIEVSFLGKPTLLSPANGSTTSLTPILDCSSVLHAETYHFQIGDSSSFTTIIWEHNYEVPTQVHSGLQYSTGYYFRVRAEANGGTLVSAWSDVWSFTTESMPPPPNYFYYALGFNISDVSKLYGSNDLATWENCGVTPLNVWRAAFGGGTLVAVRNGLQTLQYSTDSGVSWHDTGIGTASMGGLDFVNGKFFVNLDAAGLGDTLFGVSTDGVNWTTTGIPELTDKSTHTRFFYYNSNYCAISWGRDHAGNYSNYYSESYDGITWTTTIMVGFSYDDRILVEYDECLTCSDYYIVAISTLGWHSIYSTDGINWTLFRTSTTGVYHIDNYFYICEDSVQMTDVVPDDGMASYSGSPDPDIWIMGPIIKSGSTWYAIDYLNYYGSASFGGDGKKIYQSTDLSNRVNWSSSSTGIDDGVQLREIVLPPPPFVDFTYTYLDETLKEVQFHGILRGAIADSWYWYYDDYGYSYDQNPIHAFPTFMQKYAGVSSGVGFQSVAYGNNVYVAVGMGSGGFSIASSPDGLNWTTRQAGTHAMGLLGVTFDGSQFIAVGQDWTTTTGCIYTSPDGSTWTLAYLSGTDNAYRQIIYTGSKYIIAGSRDGNRPTIWSSADLSALTLDINFDSLPAYIVGSATSGSTYVCSLVETYGGVNYFLVSTDGSTWSQVFIGESIRFHRVKYCNGLFVACGQNAIYTSPDAATWTRQYSGTYDVVAVVWNGTYFIAVANQGYSLRFLFSDDAITWTQRTLPFSGDFYDLTCDVSADLILAVGIYYGDNTVWVMTQEFRQVNLSVWSSGNYYYTSRLIPTGHLATDFLWYDVTNAVYGKNDLVEFVDDVSAVLFKDKSATAPTSQEWWVFDTPVSTIANPTIDLSVFIPEVVTPGVQSKWTVTHKIIIGSTTKTIINDVLYDLLQPPVAWFYYGQVSGSLGMDFADGSSNRPSSWAWDFGAGATPATAASQSPPTVEFDSPGDKTVSLTATNVRGSDTYTTTVTVASVANFNWVIDGTNLRQINFTDTSSGAISWDWDWGDGLTHGTTQNPSHIYADFFTTYSVALTVTTSFGTFTITITIITGHADSGVLFERPDGLPDVVDVMTDLVHIARANSWDPVYNAVAEPSHTWGVSPINTMWSPILSNIVPDPTTLSYTDFDDASWWWGGYLVGNVIYMRTIDDRYFEIHFLSWSDTGGGGFSYRRWEVT